MSWFGKDHGMKEAADEARTIMWCLTSAKGPSELALKRFHGICQMASKMKDLVHVKFLKSLIKEIRAHLGTQNTVTTP